MSGLQLPGFHSHSGRPAELLSVWGRGSQLPLLSHDPHDPHDSNDPCDGEVRNRPAAAVSPRRAPRCYRTSSVVLTPHLMQEHRLHGQPGLSFGSQVHSPPSEERRVQPKGAAEFCTGRVLLAAESLLTSLGSDAFGVILAFCCSHHEDSRAQNHSADLQLREDGLYWSQEVGPPGRFQLAPMLLFCFFRFHLKPLCSVRSSRGWQPGSTPGWCRSWASRLASWTSKSRTWWRAATCASPSDWKGWS